MEANPDFVSFSTPEPEAGIMRLCVYTFMRLCAYLN